MTEGNRDQLSAEHLAKAHESLAEADALLAAGFLGGAANRAYYCCFHAARAALAVVGVRPKTHRGVSERLNADLVVPGKLEAEWLSVLGRVQLDRELADYDVGVKLQAEQVREDVTQARRFLDRLERFAKDRRAPG